MISGRVMGSGVQLVLKMLMCMFSLSLNSFTITFPGVVELKWKWW